MFTHFSKLLRNTLHLNLGRFSTLLNFTLFHFHPRKAVVQLLESPGAVSFLSCLSCFFPGVETNPVLQENHSVDLADKVMDLCCSKILKSSQIQEQSLALLLTEVPRTALN